MWLYSKLGYYSIVHKPPCNKDEILVRTRSKVDIDKLKKLLKEKYRFAGVVQDTPKADYAYRMIVPREILASLIMNAVMELNYDNFKDTIRGKDFKRHDAYLHCWEAMYEWQRDLKIYEEKKMRGKF